MADGTTPTLGLVKPEVGASKDTWGQKTNDNWDKIDAEAATTDADLAYINGQLAAKADKTYVDSQDAAQNAIIATKADASALGAYAPLNSPVFQGNPQAPTAAAADNDGTLATTQFVQRAIGIQQAPYFDTAHVQVDPSLVGKIVRLGPSVSTIGIVEASAMGWEWGSRIDFYAQANQRITFIAGSGVNIYCKAGYLIAMEGAWKGVTIHCFDNTGAGAWCLIGDLVPA